MSLLITSNLAKSFADHDIFSDVSVEIPQHARIGLVGDNGIGKTTLLKILSGEEPPTSGSVHLARELSMGYLPQEEIQTSPITLWQECLHPFRHLLKLQSELTALAEQMGAGVADARLLEQYGRLQSRFEHQGGYTFENRIRQVLSGLGFVQSDYHRPLDQFSGGERTRARLARLLLSDPDLLLLDEPTNHLDMEAVEWLEEYLKGFSGAVLLVSHDRYFLDRVVTHIWEMTPAIEEYRGNYSAYIRQREERYQRRLKEYAAQQAFIARQEEFIQRNRAGQNSRQAKGRLKRLERLLRDSKLVPPHRSRHSKFNINSSGRSGDLVLRTSQLQVGFADTHEMLFRVPNLVLRRGECAAIIGPNGAGKTTFLKTILTRIPPLTGQVELGASLQIGYFSQVHEELLPDLTLMEQIQRLAPQMLPAEVRDFLARFSFGGDMVFQTIATLSGGEQSRLALAGLVLQGANLLLLDEPTSHLDLTSQELLQQCLVDFDGTILLVSHDRYLVDAVANQIWEVNPKEKSLLVFNGTYSQYKLAKAQELQKKMENPKPKKMVKELSHPKGVNKFQVEKLEQEISALEAELKTLSVRLEQPGHTYEKVAELGNQFMNVQQKLDEKLREWDTIISILRDREKQS